MHLGSMPSTSTGFLVNPPIEFHRKYPSSRRSRSWSKNTSTQISAFFLSYSSIWSSNSAMYLRTCVYVLRFRILTPMASLVSPTIGRFAGLIPATTPVSILCRGATHGFACSSGRPGLPIIGSRPTPRLLLQFLCHREERRGWIGLSPPPSRFSSGPSTGLLLPILLCTLLNQCPGNKHPGH